MPASGASGSCLARASFLLPFPPLPFLLPSRPSLSPPARPLCLAFLPSPTLPFLLSPPSRPPSPPLLPVSPLPSSFLPRGPLPPGVGRLAPLSGVRCSRAWPWVFPPPLRCSFSWGCALLLPFLALARLSSQVFPVLYERFPASPVFANWVKSGSF